MSNSPFSKESKHWGHNVRPVSPPHRHRARDMPQHACIHKKLIEKVYCGPQRAATAGIGLGIGKCISSAFININAVLASSPGWWHLWEDMEKWTTEKQTGPTEGELHKEDTELKGTDKYGHDLIDLCRQGQYENRSENKSDLNSRISIT